MPTLTDLLRRELLTARKAGDRDLAGTLRSALAALANAEAVPVDRRAFDPEGPVARAGSTEAERRRVDDAEQHSLVRAEIDELRRAATTYAGTHPDRAAAAVSGAAALERVLAEAADPA